MEKKETYKAPEMRSVVLIKESMTNTGSPYGAPPKEEEVNEYTDPF